MQTNDGKFIYLSKNVNLSFISVLHLKLSAVEHALSIEKAALLNTVFISLSCNLILTDL